MKLADVLSGPDKWTQHHSAVDKNGHVVEIHSNDACRFCLFGVINRVYDVGPNYWMTRTTGRCLAIAAKVIKERCPNDEHTGNRVISGFNDDPERTWDDIKAVVDEIDKRMEAAVESK